MHNAAGALLGVTLLLAVTGCTRDSSGDNSLLPPPPTSAPQPTRPREPAAEPTAPLPPVPTTPSATPSPTGFPESYVSPCNGKPSAAQVIAVVRRQPALLAHGATATATVGPLCSGTWQYTVLAVTDREPMQVVTKGRPGSLTFVTAGTDVCTVDVRAEAPVALLTTADC
jgi:hypothetical protein